MTIYKRTILTTLLIIIIMIIIIIIIITIFLFPLQNGSASVVVKAGINPCVAIIKYSQWLLSL